MPYSLVIRKGKNMTTTNNTTANTGSITTIIRCACCFNVFEVDGSAIVVRRFEVTCSRCWITGIIGDGFQDIGFGIEGERTYYSEDN